MRSEWRHLTLREAGVTLIDCDHRTPKAVEAGFPYVGIPQLKQGRINLAHARHISPEDYADWTRKAHPKAYDVVLSRRCNPGESAFVSPNMDFALGQNLVLLRSDGSTLFPPFLRWLVRSPVWWEQVGRFINAGAVFDSLKCADIPNFLLPIPPISEQQDIAKTLGTLDEKVALLQETNATLEAIAQVLFKSWLVDFDPVRAKAEAREPEGVAPEIADLFPSQFEDSKMGEIPKGWTILPLDQIAEFLNGLAMQKFPAEGDSDWLPVIKIAQLRKGDSEGADRSSSRIKPPYVVDDGDVLFSWSGSLEAAIWCGGRGALNQHLFKVTSSQFPTWFYYLWIKFHLPAFREIAANKATTMGHIQRRHLSEAKVFVPPPKLLESMSAVISPLVEQSTEALLQAKVLASLRDNLLPRLMSGRLRVNDEQATLT